MVLKEKGRKAGTESLRELTDGAEKKCSTVLAGTPGKNLICFTNITDAFPSEKGKGTTSYAYFSLERHNILERKPHRKLKTHTENNIFKNMSEEPLLRPDHMKIVREDAARKTCGVDAPDF